MTLADIARQVYAAGEASYRADRSHPCVRFALDTLAAWDPARYAAVAAAVRHLAWGQHTGQVNDTHKDRQFWRYARMHRFVRVDGEPQPGDVAMMDHADGYAAHVGLLVEGGEVAHLHEKRRTLLIEPAASLPVLAWMRRI